MSSSSQEPTLKRKEPSGETNGSSKKPFRILAIDGGGIRGILPVDLIRRLSEKYPKLLSEVDMIAGVSAGSIVLAAFMMGFTPDQTHDMWYENVPKIFQEGWFEGFDLDGAIGAKYSADKLWTFLSTTGGDTTLAQCPKKVCILSMCLDQVVPPLGNTWYPNYFHNFAESPYGDLKLAEAVMRSAAAPSYFPIHNGFIDGGTIANNPSVAATSLAVDHGIKFEDIVVLSVSTGDVPKCIPPATVGTGNWGLLQWAPHILDLLLGSAPETDSLTMTSLLKSRYFRLDPKLPRDIKLDNYKEIPFLSEFAAQVDLTDAEKWLEEVWKSDTSATSTKRAKTSEESERSAPDVVHPTATAQPPPEKPKEGCFIM